MGVGLLETTRNKGHVGSDLFCAEGLVYILITQAMSLIERTQGLRRAEELAAQHAKAAADMVSARRGSSDIGSACSWPRLHGGSTGWQDWGA